MTSSWLLLRANEKLDYRFTSINFKRSAIAIEIQFFRVDSHQRKGAYWHCAVKKRQFQIRKSFSFSR